MNNELGMMNKSMKPMAHIAQRPLSIEREYTLQGREVIIIEGVRYDADYFRTFSHPETDVLYAVVRDEDAVRLTVIQTPEQASEFFDPAPSAAIAAPPPKAGESTPILGEEYYEGVDDGL